MQQTMAEVERVEKIDKEHRMEEERKKLNLELDIVKSETIRRMGILNQAMSNDTIKNSIANLNAANNAMEALECITEMSQGCGQVVIERRRSHKFDHMKVFCKWTSYDEDGSKTVTTKEIFSDKGEAIEWDNVEFREDDEDK